MNRAWLCVFSLCALACAGRSGPDPETPAQKPMVAEAPEPDPQPVGDPPPRTEVSEASESSIPCERPEEYGPVVVDVALYGKRRGASASRFSEIVSQKAEAIEACGVRGSLQELLRLRCDDGSNPFKSAEQAHSSRSGNVGPGGRCGSIVDLYRVPCPEKTYDVYIDMYICAGATEAS